MRPNRGKGRSYARRGGSSRSASAGSSRGCLTQAARALLGRIEAQFGAMQIISTCRPGARIAGSGRISKHASGNAVDFNAGGRKGAVVRWLIANHKSGGIMTYSGMSHIHVDIGPRFVSLGARGGASSTVIPDVSSAIRDQKVGGSALAPSGPGCRSQRAPG